VKAIRFGVYLNMGVLSVLSGSVRLPKGLCPAPACQSARDRSLHAKPLGTRRGRAKEKSRITAAIDGTVGQHCGKMNLAYHPASPERKVNADVLTFQDLVHIIWNLECFSQAVALPYHGRPSREMVSLALTFSTSRQHSI
jgi:hypothetical protein